MAVLTAVERNNKKAWEDFSCEESRRLEASYSEKFVYCFDYAQQTN